jgi:hypothetical protein
MDGGAALRKRARDACSSDTAAGELTDAIAQHAYRKHWAHTVHGLLASSSTRAFGTEKRFGAKVMRRSAGFADMNSESPGNRSSTYCSNARTLRVVLRDPPHNGERVAGEVLVAPRQAAQQTAHVG